MKNLKQKHAELVEIIGDGEAKRLLHAWYTRAIRRERKRANLPEQDPALFELIHDDLNERLGIQSKLSKDEKCAILALLNAEYTLDDFRAVHKFKCIDWLQNEQMRQHLHWSTLYRSSKFPKYLQQAKLNKVDFKQKKTTRKRDLKKWQECDNIVELSNLVNSLSEAERKNYELPGKVEAVLDQLPMARLNGKMEQLQELYKSVREKDIGYNLFIRNQGEL